MFWLLCFAVFLFILSAILLVSEVFIPSFGMLTICSVLCLIGGCVIFFKFSTTVGIIGITVALIMIPVMLVFTYKVLPQTEFGKAVVLAPPTQTGGSAIPDSKELEEMLGLTGEVLTDLRPVGMCDFAMIYNISAT